MTHAMPGPNNVVRTTLDNGLTLLVRENHSAPVTVLEGYLPVGSIHDPKGQFGLASLAATMTTHGSKRYDFEAFNEIIESVGANLSVHGDTHVTGFGLSCLSEDFPTLLGVLAETLRRPTYPAERLAIVQGQLAVDFQERLHDTQRMSALRFYETLFGGHPYGRADIGYSETVASVTPDDLRAFHQAHYTPQGAIIVLSGDIKTQAAIDNVSQALGDWRGPAANQHLATPAAVSGQRVDIDMADKSQADIVMGCQAVPREHPDFFPIRVANTILGRFGMMGRLGEVVREQQGLAYYSYSTQEADPAAGAWYANAGVNPGDVEQAVASIRAEFERLGSEPVGAGELQDSQDFLTGVLPLTLETNAGVATTLLNMEWHGLGLDYLSRYNDLIYGVTAEDVQRVAQTYLRAEDLVTVVAGPG